MHVANQIIALRTRDKLSQSDLAEKIGVSRQSVSKWETGTSTPDLEKLILLSELFSVSLDELVKQSDDTDTQNTPHAQTYTRDNTDTPFHTTTVPTNTAITAPKIIGYILLCFGLLSAILALFLGILLFIPAILFVCSAMFCLKATHHIGLKIAWIWFSALLFIVTPAMTGIYLGAIFNPYFYTSGFTIQLLIVTVIWMVYLLLSVKTIMIPKHKKGKILAACWCMSAYCLQSIFSALQIAIYVTTHTATIPTRGIVTLTLNSMFILATIIATVCYRKT